ncbi:hypothetical protein K1T71_007734 [Dendrolimus kikuchii]|uniref:Uncharacterized protein n=1 Tax=Dendrolimus kikuchii TaxID=765133 RepID=A0ACC1CYK2_9NEOP|nr:hypothetical protein K1T71_007734 [Dendrolimus kikuchii]
MYRFAVFRQCKEIMRYCNKNYTSKTILAAQNTIEDMPHPKELPLVGTKLDFYMFGGGTNLHEYINSRHKQLGPVFYERLGGTTKLIFISDPALIKSLFLNLEGKYPTHILPEPWILYENLYGSKRGLFFMNGEEWLSNRRIMNKYLLREDSEKWLEGPIRDTIYNFVQNLHKKVQNGNYELKSESDFYRLSINVILGILLGTNDKMKPTNQYEMLLDIFSEWVKKIFITTTKLYGLPIYWFYRLNLKPWRDFKECVDNSLLLAQKLVSEVIKEGHGTTGLIKKLADENISEETVTRIVSDFIIAAGDTTAYTSLWTLYLIAQNPKIMQEFKEKENYAKFLIKEAMRLYPVAPFLTRILPKDSNLQNFRLSEGTPIIASIYTSGRDEAYFTKANEFLPYRWDRHDARQKELLNHNPTASLPFAFGARSCIGKKIAMLQLTEFVNQMTSNFEIKCMNKTEVKAITSQILVPKEPIHLCISSRN